jgi:hypothetical protein
VQQYDTDAEMQNKTMYKTGERVMFCGMTSTFVCMLLWQHM